METADIQARVFVAARKAEDIMKVTGGVLYTNEAYVVQQCEQVKWTAGFE